MAKHSPQLQALNINDINAILQTYGNTKNWLGKTNDQRITYRKTPGGKTKVFIDGKPLAAIKKHLFWYNDVYHDNKFIQALKSIGRLIFSLFSNTYKHKDLYAYYVVKRAWEKVLQAPASHKKKKLKRFHDGLYFGRIKNALGIGGNLTNMPSELFRIQKILGDVLSADSRDNQRLLLESSRESSRRYEESSRRNEEERAHLDERFRHQAEEFRLVREESHRLAGEARHLIDEMRRDNEEIRRTIQSFTPTIRRPEQLEHLTQQLADPQTSSVISSVATEQTSTSSPALATTASKKRKFEDTLGSENMAARMKLFSRRVSSTSQPTPRSAQSDLSVGYS